MKKVTQTRPGLAEVVEIRPGAAQLSHVDQGPSGPINVGPK